MHQISDVQTGAALGDARGHRGDDLAAPVPLPPSPVTYAVHAYVRTARLDPAGRAVAMTLPLNPDVPDALQIGGTLAYARRGLPTSAGVTFAVGEGTAGGTSGGGSGTGGAVAFTRVVVSATEYDADGLVTRVVYGDGSATRAGTEAVTEYDVRNRPTRMWTVREATGTTSLSAVTVVADQRLTWDAASNLTGITDGRTASEWPAGARPQSVSVTHDALYRVTGAHFTYAQPAGEAHGGTQDDASVDWRAEVLATKHADSMRSEPAAMLPAASPMRVRDLVWSYDWLGNMTEWSDDAHSFYERSLGDVRNGYGDREPGATGAAARPSALYFAADLGGPDPTDRGGYVEVSYGEGGNVVAMTAHARCADVSETTRCAAPETPYGEPAGGPGSAQRAALAHARCVCAAEQHYQYRWDELDRLVEARRYDRDARASPAWRLKVRQRYRYDSANQRTIKATWEPIVDHVGDADGGGAGGSGSGGSGGGGSSGGGSTATGDGLDDADGDPEERIALYVYAGDVERRGLRKTALGDGYEPAWSRLGPGPGAPVGPIAETQYLVAGARVVWAATTAEPPDVAHGVAFVGAHGALRKATRVTLPVGDLIGTTTAVLDLDSGELVEASTYYPNGARETFVRNTSDDDDAVMPEPAGFTGKEADEEVGLVYFGERYLIPRLGRWASPDPLQIHAGGGGEFGNSYHYVGGNFLEGRDPLGLEDISSDADPRSRIEDHCNTSFESCSGVTGATTAPTPTAAPTAAPQRPAPGTGGPPRSRDDVLATGARAVGRFVNPNIGTPLRDAVHAATPTMQRRADAVADGTLAAFEHIDPVLRTASGANAGIALAEAAAREAKEVQSTGDAVALAVKVPVATVVDRVAYAATVEAAANPVETVRSAAHLGQAIVRAPGAAIARLRQARAASAAGGAARGGAGVVRVGQAGEAAVRSVADIGPKVAIEVAGRTRIPDGLTSTVLTEVKKRGLAQLHAAAPRVRRVCEGERPPIRPLGKTDHAALGTPRTRGRQRSDQPAVHPMTKKKITAAELMAKLNADPEFVAKRAREEEERLKREAEYRRAEAPLVDELRAAGFQVQSAWDLVNTPGSYPKAVPILLAHLPRPYPAAVREGIARALAVPEAKVGWNVLTQIYRDEQDKRAKDGLAVAIAAAADEDVISDVIALARDTQHGPSRLLLLSALERSADPRARATLMDLGTDPELKKEVQIILRRLKQAKR